MKVARVRFHGDLNDFLPPEKKGILSVAKTKESSKIRDIARHLFPVNHLSCAKMDRVAIGLRFCHRNYFKF
jgi:hypothetical protein